MESIMDWIKTEAMIFKGGSARELICQSSALREDAYKRRITSSGPVSFMRGADSVTGMIKSGGATPRRKKCFLNIDHPDVLEFIRCKAEEEKKSARVLSAGYNMQVERSRVGFNQYQNANNSVRLSDEFLKPLKAIKNGTRGL